MSQERQPLLVHADEGEALWFLGSLVTVKVSGAQTGSRLTVVDFVNPPGFAPPLHRHRDDDEVFHLLSGTASFRCDGQELVAGPGDTVLLPSGLAHTFLVGPDEPMHYLQITAPSGFEEFAREVGSPALTRSLPTVRADVDPAELIRAAAAYGVEILGPPPTS